MSRADVGERMGSSRANNGCDRARAEGGDRARVEDGDRARAEGGDRVRVEGGDRARAEVQSEGGSSVQRYTELSGVVVVDRRTDAAIDSLQQQLQQHFDLQRKRAAAAGGGGGDGWRPASDLSCRGNQQQQRGCVIDRCSAPPCTGTASAIQHTDR